MVSCCPSPAAASSAATLAAPTTGTPTHFHSGKAKPVQPLTSRNRLPVFIDDLNELAWWCPAPDQGNPLPYPTHCLLHPEPPILQTTCLRMTRSHAWHWLGCWACIILHSFLIIWWIPFGKPSLPSWNKDSWKERLTQIFQLISWLEMLIY